MKKKITLLSLVAIFIALLTLSVNAITIKEFSSDSTYKPVSYSTHKSVSSVTLYGNADYLCMKAYSEKNSTELFCLDIYSDSKYKNPVSMYSNTFKVGTKYDNILFDLTGFESGTYYAMAYVKKQPALSYYDGYLKKDPATEVKFKIIIDRKGSSDIKNSKLVMFAYENTEEGPTVYWYNQPKAKGYYIYRKEGDTYKKIATLKTNKGNFGQYTDKSLKGKNGTKYYKIKAYSGSTVSGFSKNYVKAVIIKTPTVKAQTVYNDRVEVTWSSVGVKNATYYVYRAKGKNGEWENLGSTTNTYYYDSIYSSNALKNNVTYYYTVIAETSNAVSGHDVSGVAVRFLQSPKLKTAVAAKDGITITWDKRNGAEAYEVYRRTNPDNAWEKIGTTDSATYTYTDTTANESTVYFYTVKATKGNYVGSYINRGLCTAYFPAPVVNEITEYQSEYPIITWSEVANCNRYAIYRKEAGSSEWKEIAKTDTTTYTDTSASLESGKEYFYTVKGICNYSYNSEEFEDYYLDLYSEMDETGKSAVFYGILKGLTPVIAEQGISLKWDKTAGAGKYNIYRKGDTEEFVLIGTTEDTSYGDLTALKDIAYTYKVTYFVGDKEMTTYSAETNAQLKDNILRLTDDERIKESNCNYYTVKIQDCDPFAKYSVYLKTEDGLKLNSSSIASDGTLHITKPSEDITQAEFIITAVMEDGTIYGFEGAESFLLYYRNFEGTTINSNQQKSQIELSWPAVEGADKYYVYRTNELIATVEDGTEYIDTNVEDDKHYSYKIGIVIDNCVIIEQYRALGYIIKTPVVKAEIKEGYVNLSWDNQNATFEVLRRKEGETNWTKLNSQYGYTYADKAVEDSQVYYYTVRPKHDTYGYGKYDETGVRVCFMKPVILSKLETSGSKIIVEWPEKKAAEAYKLYRKAYGDSKWTLIKTLDKDTLSYEDSDIISGTRYYYGVIATSGTSKSVREGKGILYLAPVKLVSAKATTNGITVKFENLGKTDSYVIYRKTKSTAWKKIATLSSTASSYTDKSVKSGTKYTYTVGQVRSSIVGPYDTKGLSATAK